jgi:hypothetical protein
MSLGSNGTLIRQAQDDEAGEHEQNYENISREFIYLISFNVRQA